MNILKQTLHYDTYGLVARVAMWYGLLACVVTACSETDMPRRMMEGRLIIENVTVNNQTIAIS